MSNIDAPIFNTLVDLLAPHMSEESYRRAFMNSALSGCTVLRKIVYAGDADTFTRNLISRLDTYGDYKGRPTLVAVLEQLKLEVGIDKHHEINHLLLRITHPIDIKTFPAAKDTTNQIFISYARPEQAIAEQVESVLLQAGYQVFRDTSDIRSGDDWDRVIEQALRDCDRMVLLLSKSSMPDRKEVKREWFYFDQKNKPIHPLYIEDCDLHSRFMAYNYIDCRTDLQGALLKLLSELDQADTTSDGAGSSLLSPTLSELTAVVKQLNQIDWLPAWTVIPGGKFRAGDKSVPNAPERDVELQPYALTKTPITQAQYQRFVRIAQHRLPIDDFSPDYSWDAVTRTPPQDKFNHPVVLVSADDADAYCQWLNDELHGILRTSSGLWEVNLPVGAEWELAARGIHRYPYPWGEGLPSPKLANFDSTGTSPVGQYEHQRPYDVLDMIGNVWEWTHDSDGDKRILRGGSWQPGINLSALHAAYRYPESPDFIHETIGFRIVIRQIKQGDLI